MADYPFCGCYVVFGDYLPDLSRIAVFTAAGQPLVPLRTPTELAQSRLVQLGPADA